MLIRRTDNRRLITLGFAGLAAVLMTLTLVTMLPGAQGLAGPVEGESIADWTARWLEGPVSLIATDEEQEIFDDLDTTQERLQFIRLFWERRDPLLRGPRNEYLDEFERRLTYAVENFESRREPAWKTSFGQVVMHFGPPDRTRREGSYPDGLSSRPPILWSYDERYPGLEPNEMLLFVYRAGRWKLMPPQPIGISGIPVEMRLAEARSVLPGIPAEYREAIDLAIDRSLVNPINYKASISNVRTAVLLPEAQIPFGWSTKQTASADGKASIDIELTFRLDSLVFHLVEGAFTTDMVIDAQLRSGGEPSAVASERVMITVPEVEMDSRRQETVQRIITIDAPTGAYTLELLLLDQLLGYRTVYRDELQVKSP